MTSPDNTPGKNFFDRELRVFAPVYFVLAFINLRVKLFFTPLWFNGHLVSEHENLLSLQGVNNDQSRILQFWIPELLHRLLSISVEDAYILQRWTFVFLAYVCFHKYLRKWFGPAASFAGVSFLAAIMPLAYFNHLQESAPLLLLTFLLGLWAIRENRIVPLLAVFFIGGLNNETMLILPLAYLAYHFKTLRPADLLPLCLRTFLLSLPLLATVGTIRYITRHRPHGDDPWQLPYNIKGIVSSLRILGSPELTFLHLHRAVYLYIFIIFGAFWIYAFLRLKDKPLFLRRASVIIPFFIIGHFLTGIIYEVRQMIPLGFLIIPMAMCHIFPVSIHEKPGIDDGKKKASSDSDSFSA